MGVLDKRSVVHDGDEPKPGNVLISSSKTIVEERDAGEKTINLDVPPEMASLTVAVSGPDSAPAGEPPRGVEKVTLVHESGEEIRPVAPDNVHGRFIFVVEKPRPGRWRVLVSHVKESAFVVRAVALRDHAIEYVREKWPSMRCGVCVEGIHGAVAIAVSLLVSSVGGAVAPAGFIAYVAGRTGLSEKIIEYILERMYGTRMDRLVDGVCERMGMCTA